MQWMLLLHASFSCGAMPHPQLFSISLPPLMSPLQLTGGTAHGFLFDQTKSKKEIKLWWSYRGATQMTCCGMD